jgi:hypothetical protein
MDIWDNCCMREEDSSAKINMMLDGQNLIMYFTKDNQLYGCSEESRLTFARMKHPNKDDANLKEARFGAINLYDALTGKITENLFSKKDLKGLKIVSKDKCESLLIKKMNGKKTKPKPVMIVSSDADQEDDRRPLRSEKQRGK